MKAVVVTGVSSGIGEAIARDLAERGYTVFGSVRDPGQAVGLQAELGSRFEPLLFDVVDASAIDTAAAYVADRVGTHGLRGLVNNAGIAVSGPLMNLDLDQVRRQFDVNVIGALAVTQRFLPLLGARANPSFPPGRIINISSVAVSAVFPFVVPYAASKQALEAMSHGLRRELQLYGVDVVLVAPGVVATPIWSKHEEDASRYAHTAFSSAISKASQMTMKLAARGMPVDRVARVVCRALESDNPRVRYVVPVRRISLHRLIPWVPVRRLDRIIARRLGLHPQSGVNTKTQ